MYEFPFEKLEVWHLAKRLVISIYAAAESFPAAERFGLVSQLQRAAVSVASNLAEGCSRESRKEQAHFSQIAYGSLMEVICQLLIAHELGYIANEQLTLLRAEIERIANKINALRKYQIS